MSALIHLWMGGSKVFPSYALNTSLALRKPLAPLRLHEAQSENHSPNRPGGCLLATNTPTYIAFDRSPERPATVLEGFVFHSDEEVPWCRSEAPSTDGLLACGLISSTLSPAVCKTRTARQSWTIPGDLWLKDSISMRACLVVSDYATPWTVTRQVPLSMGFPKREYWSGLPFPFPEDLPKHRYIATAAKLLQSCPTLCDPIDGSPPGSPVPGIPQARILEWVAMPSSRGSSQLRD